VVVGSPLSPWCLNNTFKGTAFPVFSNLSKLGVQLGVFRRNIFFSVPPPPRPFPPPQSPEIQKTFCCRKVLTLLLLFPGNVVVFFSSFPVLLSLLRASPRGAFSPGHLGSISFNLKWDQEMPLFFRHRKVKHLSLWTWEGVTIAKQKFSPICSFTACAVPDESPFSQPRRDWWLLKIALLFFFRFGCFGFSLYQRSGKNWVVPGFCEVCFGWAWRGSVRPVLRLPVLWGLHHNLKGGRVTWTLGCSRTGLQVSPSTGDTNPLPAAFLFVPNHGFFFRDFCLGGTSFPPHITNGFTEPCRTPPPKPQTKTNKCFFLPLVCFCTGFFFFFFPPPQWGGHLSLFFHTRFFFFFSASPPHKMSYRSPLKHFWEQLFRCTLLFFIHIYPGRYNVNGPSAPVLISAPCQKTITL